MWSYERIKKFIQDHKSTLVLLVSFITVFFAGFGSGKYDKYRRLDTATLKKHYNTTRESAAQTPETLAPETREATVSENRAAAPETKTTQQGTGNAPCPVKGNISAKGSKIYHVQGGAFYERVKEEQCFKTEQEATAAGFRKSAR